MDIFEPAHIRGIRAVGGPARLAYALRAWGSVNEVLAKLDRGGSLFAISASQFSSIDVIAAIARKIGACDLDLWTYAPGEAEIEALSELLAIGEIGRLRLVLDQSGMHTRAAGVYSGIQRRFGTEAMRVSKAHAKLAAFSTADGWRILFDGSLNLAKNKRFEQVSIRDDPAAWGLVSDLTDELFAACAPPDLSRFTGADARRTVDTLTGLRRRARSKRVPAGFPMRMI